MNLGV